MRPEDIDINDLFGDVSTEEKQADLRSDISLQPHQQAVVNKVQNQLDKQDKARILLYHSLGSGKTLSGLSAADATKLPYTAVVPAALRNNLRKEQERFIDPATATPSSVMSHTAVGKGDPIENPQSILVDETHRFRNPESAQATNLMNAAEKARQVVLLTGTPVVNSPGDFAVPYSILTGERISPEDFNKRYVNETPTAPWYKRLFGTKPQEPEITNQEELKDKLKGKIDYFAPLAPKAEINRKDVVVEMNRDQTDLNSYMMGQLPAVLRWKLRMHYPLTQEEISKMTSFMTGLRQVGLSTLPFMKDKPDTYKAFQQSPKLTKAFSNLKELLDKDPKGKALIFSNFIDAGLNPYQEALTRAGIPAASFTGTLSDRQRKKLVDDYNADKLRVALLGPAGTEGLSFKGTKLVQLLDPHWNTTRGRQSEGRALRFDSHEHLPPEDRKVLIERYIARTAPGRLRSLLRNVGIKAEPEMATDDYLIASADRKQKLNEKFLDLLKQIGSSDKKVEKKASPLKTLGHLGLAGLGGLSAYKAQDAYLNKVNPEVTDFGRLKSNLFTSIIGAGLAANPMATARAIKNNPRTSILGGAGLAAREAFVVPNMDHAPLFVGLGGVLDPGKSKFPEWSDTLRDPTARGQVSKFIQSGPQNLGSWLPDKALDVARSPENLAATVKSIKEDTLPAVYGSIINSLGGSTKDPNGGPDLNPTLSDVGTALAPHIAGGLGGAYLGGKLLGRVGDFFFGDNPDDEYEVRRNQENRRWWLKFLGSNLGAVGGAFATTSAMPHINKAVSSYMNKKGNAKALLKPFVSNAGTHLLGGAGLTAAQYGMGIVPNTKIGPDGNLNPSATPAPRSDLGYLSGLFGANTLVSALTGGPKLLLGRSKSPITHSMTLGAATVGGPSAANLASTLIHVPNLTDSQKIDYEKLNQSYSDPTGNIAKGVTDRATSDDFQNKLKNYGSDLAKGVGLPSFGDASKQLFGSAGLATLAQGAGLLGGGVVGMTGGGWLADKLMSLAVKKKLMKKRPELQAFISDLASLTGAGIGAYAGLRGLNEVIRRQGPPTKPGQQPVVKQDTKPAPVPVTKT